MASAVIFPPLKVQALLPRYEDAEYVQRMEELPEGLFDIEQMQNLGLFHLEKIPHAKDCREYPTAYIPTSRFEDFRTGESHRGSNPLDPHDSLFKINKTRRRVPKHKTDQVITKSLNDTFTSTLDECTPPMSNATPTSDSTDHVTLKMETENIIKETYTPPPTLPECTPSMCNATLANEPTTDPDALPHPLKRTHETPPYPYYRQFMCHFSEGKSKKIGGKTQSDTSSTFCDANFSVGPPIITSSGTEMVSIRYKN